MPMLKIQFAMHPSIAQFPNKYFYNGDVKDGPNVMSIEYIEFLLITLPSYGIIDILAQELQHTRKIYVSLTIIFMLAQNIFEGIVFSWSSEQRDMNGEERLALLSMQLTCIYVHDAPRINP